MNRRNFLTACAALPWLAGCRPTNPVPSIAGGFADPDFALGHRLRDGGFPAPTETLKIPVAIVGGGIGGLTAAWRLQKRGFAEFVILEMESAIGGNSRWGDNAVSAYPWGAHYLPLPTRESVAVRELLADLGVIRGDPFLERPEYEERYLCASPQERLYRNGRWQEGLLPAARGQVEKDQQRRFEELMAGFKARRGAHGEKAFAIPMELSARDADLLALDRLSFKDWLLQQGITAPSVHWYADYACRDDYGSDYDRVSAWAGVHYFASRDGQGQNAESGSILTWPEGNGWIVRQLQERLRGLVRTGACVFRLEADGKGVALDVYLAGEGRSIRIVAEQAIWAAPLFLLPKVMADCPAPWKEAAARLEYSPWAVANLELDGFPEEKHGAPLSWDNVIQDSPSLGYVVATHQQWRQYQPATVFTWYRALSTGPADAARKALLASNWESWRDVALADLGKVYDDLPERVRCIQVRRHAHAMARPLVGSLWGSSRAAWMQGSPRLHLAHADMSGFSIFEEACSRGVAAAERVIELTAA